MGGNPWTEDEIKLLIDMYENYMGDIKSVANEYFPNHTYPSILKKARKLGIKRSQNAISTIRSNQNKKENIYDLDTYEYGVGYVYNDNYEFYFDKEDYDLIKKYCWHKHTDGYLRCCYDYYIDENNIRHNIYIMLHQLLSKYYFDGKMLDHINGRPYDNRKENLRQVIHVENMKNLKLYNSNKSGHKGVYQLPNGVWNAYITSDGKRYNLGNYDTFDDAKEIREEAEKRYFKEYNRDVEYL